VNATCKLVLAALGYHKDPQTRAAFMEVLTKILQQGTEFETLAETALADRFERLVELVTMIGDKGELPIAMALAQVVSNTQMVSVLFTLLCVYNNNEKGHFYGTLSVTDTKTQCAVQKDARYSVYICGVCVCVFR